MLGNVPHLFAARKAHIDGRIAGFRDRVLSKNNPNPSLIGDRFGFRVLTKSRKNEAQIRNDGVYVISGIFCGAHEGRALCAKQAEVSPVSNKSHKHALRAMWIDDCELWMQTLAKR